MAVSDTDMRIYVMAEAQADLMWPMDDGGVSRSCPGWVQVHAWRVLLYTETFRAYCFVESIWKGPVIVCFELGFCSEYLFTSM